MDISINEAYKRAKHAVASSNSTRHIFSTKGTSPAHAVSIVPHQPTYGLARR
jgi:hypothetical protein